MCVRVLPPLQLLDPASDLEDVAFTGKNQIENDNDCVSTRENLERSCRT